MTGRSEHTVTRAVLRDAVYRSCTSLSREQASKVLNETIEDICEALVRGETVKLRAFGIFKVRSKRERIGRNPKTGVQAPICARRTLTFKASPVLIAHVNGETIPDAED
jgi:integration host factor subunit alpha